MAQVSPSKMNLLLYKTKIKAATLGHKLLTKKRDALKGRFREIMIELIDVSIKIA